MNGTMNTNVKYYAEVTRESLKAICCYLDGDRINHWIPRSQIQPGTQVRRGGDVGLLIVSDWFARTAHLPAPAACRDESIEY